MPMNWDSTNDQRLLMVYIGMAKINSEVAVKMWKRLYPDQTQPTARAITEHVGKLKKVIGMPGSGTSPTTTVDPSASKPNKPSTPQRGPGKSMRQTPGSKRKKASMSDEDDSEAEQHWSSKSMKGEESDGADGKPEGSPSLARSQRASTRQLPSRKSKAEARLNLQQALQSDEAVSDDDRESVMVVGEDEDGDFGEEKPDIKFEDVQVEMEDNIFVAGAL